MKVKIDHDYNPMFYITDYYGTECDIPEELVKQYEAHKVEYDLVQKLLKSYYDAAKKKERLEEAIKQGVYRHEIY